MPNSEAIKTEDSINTVPQSNGQKAKRRRRRKNKGKTNTQDVNNVNQNNSKPLHPAATDNHVADQSKDHLGKKKKRKRRGRGLDRYFGRFHCNICKRRWDSAHVFTVAGTKKVLWKQRCKNCNGDDAWKFPYQLELLRCSICQSDICECTCDVCHKLIHLRYIFIQQEEPEGTVEERIIDDNFEYCKCDRRKSKAWLGANNDPKKQHLSSLCQKCLNGFPCMGGNEDLGDANPEDNEA